VIKVAPSILASDFSKLGEEIRDVVCCGADYIHIDVMDGNFVPNITIGPVVVRAVRKMTDLVFDVHLMISDPDQYIADFADAGADIINVHYETCRHLNRTIQKIRECGKKAGVTINPATPVSVIGPILEFVDLVLVMSVNPGFGGQEFQPSTLKKVRDLVKIRNDNGYRYEIEIDGGVDEKNIEEVIMAGVDVVVAGTSVFSSKDRKKTIDRLKGNV
jgi:ribulose-phosphate 3-epimerase